MVKIIAAALLIALGAVVAQATPLPAFIGGASSDGSASSDPPPPPNEDDQR